MNIKNNTENEQLGLLYLLNKSNEVIKQNEELSNELSKLKSINETLNNKISIYDEELKNEKNKLLDFIFPLINNSFSLGYILNKYISKKDLTLSSNDSGNCSDDCMGTYTIGNRRCDCGNRRINCMFYIEDDELFVTLEAY